MKEIKINLPIPPSVNSAYTDRKNGAGRAKSRKAVQFSIEALRSMYGLPKAIEEHIRIMNKKKEDLIRSYVQKNPAAAIGASATKILLAAIYGIPSADRPFYHVEVDIFFKNDSRPRDIMNFEKLATDFLVGVGILLDDYLIESFTIRRGAFDKNNPRMEYTIKIFNDN